MVVFGGNEYDEQELQKDLEPILVALEGLAKNYGIGGNVGIMAGGDKRLMSVEIYDHSDSRYKIFKVMRFNGNGEPLKVIYNEYEVEEGTDND